MRNVDWICHWGAGLVVTGRIRDIYNLLLKQEVLAAPVTAKLSSFLISRRNVLEIYHLYEGHLESKERFAIQRYLLIIGKKKNMQVL